MKLLVTLLFTTLSAQALADNSHCSKEEKTVFPCTVGKKIVSICASQNLSPTAGYMQYRFGRKGMPELSIPRPDQHPLKHVEVDAYQAGSGQTGSITFKNGQYSYTVNWSDYRSDSAAPNGASIWVREAGLTMARNGKAIAERQCSPSEGGVLGVDPYYLHTEVGFPED